MDEFEIDKAASEVVREYLRDVRDNGPDNIQSFTDSVLLGLDATDHERVKVDSLANRRLREIFSRLMDDRQIF